MSGSDDTSTPLDRRAAVRALVAERGDLLVVAGLGSSAYDLAAAGDHPANFYLWGAMGGAALMGFGLALAQPTRPVLVITGDGEQLMGLGGLATIGVQRPANLTVVVLDNGHFGETGMQRSHTGLGVDLVAVAMACGFAWAHEVKAADDLTALARRSRSKSGCGFARVVVAAENPPRVLPPRDGVHLKHRFRQELGLGVS
ncbi:MAG: aldehyde dehydrogenase [Proteobacteria bacterium]|nr:aldehyde dehydrogenase [Pseudomonadota bacterium]